MVLPETYEQALDELEVIMKDGKFSTAGSSVVIEEYMEGDEISVLTFTDGITFKSLPAGQDHKRIYDGNRGPNTGGMGVYSPVPFVTKGIMADINEKILLPTFKGFIAEGDISNSTPTRRLHTDTTLSRESISRSPLHGDHADSERAESS